MPVSRRGFLRLIGTDGASAAAVDGAWLSARGLEAHFAEAQAQGQRARPVLPPGVEEIRISSNENPLGPGRAVLDAMMGKFPEAGRYPFNSSPTDSALTAALADKFRVKPENLVLGAGSQARLGVAAEVPRDGAADVRELHELREEVQAAARRGEGRRGDAARRRGHDRRGLEGRRGARLFNNPNNPTATVHGGKTVADMVER